MNRLLAGPGHEHRAHISPSGDGRDDKSRRIKGAYILCSTRPFAGEAAGRAKQRGYRYRELMSAAHDAMITQPRALTKILIELA